MARKRTKVLLAVLLVFLVGITVTGSLIGLQVSTEFGGRVITVESANVLSQARVAVEPSGAVVQLGQRRITITKDSVTLPEGAPIAIPAVCKRIAVRETSDGVRVLLDGVAAN